MSMKPSAGPAVDLIPGRRDGLGCTGRSWLQPPGPARPTQNAGLRISSSFPRPSISSGWPVPLTTMRILVVEDDDAIRSVLERGLQAEGFDVETCSDGASGLWKALDRGFAAIVLDLLLPQLSGYQVCARLREEGVTTPILALTAKSGELDQIDLLDIGADDFLTKPASIAVIALNCSRHGPLPQTNRRLRVGRDRGAKVRDLLLDLVLEPWGELSFEEAKRSLEGELV